MKVFSFIIRETSNGKAESRVFSSNTNKEEIKLDFVGEIQAISWHHTREFISKENIAIALNTGYFQLNNQVEFFLVEADADYSVPEKK